jgi:hypothetical protein
MALRAAKADKDAAQPLWGRRFDAAVELPLGPDFTSLPVAPAISSPVFVWTAPSRRRREIPI